MPIIATGKTFDHKEAIKQLGGKWNADRKCWILPDSAAAGLQRLRLGFQKDGASPRGSARPARIHPDALTSRGNNGFGPDDVAYDDI